MNELEAPVQPSPAEGEKSVVDAGNRKVPNKRHRQRPRIKSDSDVPKVLLCLLVLMFSALATSYGHEKPASVNLLCRDFVY
ncbi:unnamed protein product [Nippostrongylus brasiliensis]|uniref:Uncharacterized protein n=1 Tax=Nippostrongylus brasiliensis TaxID=27835 RepID=A0A0N4YFP9_NIPBR|nr:unnamed protein product [Nippostrongylus brasiliensis]